MDKAPIQIFQNHPPNTYFGAPLKNLAKKLFMKSYTKMVVAI